MDFQQKNRNFQIFKESNNEFVNLSEYYGSKIFATASGKFEVVSTTFPSKINAYVSKISLIVFGNVFSFLISGQGIVIVQFIDKDNRIFENEKGARVLQRKVPLPVEYENLS